VNLQTSIRRNEVKAQQQGKVEEFSTKEEKCLHNDDKCTHKEKQQQKCLHNDDKCTHKEKQEQKCLHNDDKCTHKEKGFRPKEEKKEESKHGSGENKL